MISRNKTNGMVLALVLVTPIQFVSSFISPPSFTHGRRKSSCIIPYSSKVEIDQSSIVTGSEATKSTTPFDILSDNDILPAIKAVRKACYVTHSLQEVLCPISGCVTKDDSSPVTIADYASQAIVLDNLRTYFPADCFLAEESSKVLLENDTDNEDGILEHVVKAVQSISGPAHDVDYVLDSIDLGQTFYDDDKNERLWCLDPIDGTKGFLRGADNGQYCVALCLLVNGKPEVGILGCPNLHTDKQSNEKGCIFIAKRNKGCYQLSLNLDDDNDNVSNNNKINNDAWIQNISNDIKKISVTKSDESEIPLHDSIFCIGVEKYSDPSGQCDAMAELIHGNDAIDEDGSIIKAIKMDSQAKYGLVSRGEAQVYLRLPKPEYVEWIWDHAAGSLIIEEAGGKVTDVNGNALDFSLGSKLSPDVSGIIGTNGGIFHDTVLNAYHTQRKRFD